MRVIEQEIKENNNTLGYIKYQYKQPYLNKIKED